MTSHSPESASLPLAIQASSTQMPIDADRGSHDVSSVPRPISSHQSLVATDVGAHEPDHTVHEPHGPPPIQPAVPATTEGQSAADGHSTAEGHSMADEETSPSSHPNDAPAEPPAAAAAANPPLNPFRHSVLGLNTKYSHQKPRIPSQVQRELSYLCLG